MKRLALFLDGTWNDPASNTNVARLHARLAAHDAGGIRQCECYQEGVGNRWHNRITGGALGRGLSENLRDAYAWLVEQYEDDDEIYLFGFSRGAYTARSVAGLIVKCGLLRSRGLSVDDVYQRYRQGKAAVPIYELEYARDSGTRALTRDEQRLLEHSRRVPIRMIGVWDTVGALGIPWTSAPLVGRGRFYFHNTNPSKLFEHAYQALAIDEHRGPYKPALWTRFVPDGQPIGTAAESGGPVIEQRWFAGAHADVGGGYDDDRLARRPLAWMQRKAEACGLAFDAPPPEAADDACRPVDSYARFLGGAYRVLRLGARYHRPIGAGARRVKGGVSVPINESIDASVLRKLRVCPDYRPKNLLAFAQNRGIDLERIEPRDLEA